jgi:hypothetical protein
MRPEMELSVRYIVQFFIGRQKIHKQVFVTVSNAAVFRRIRQNLNIFSAEQCRNMMPALA